MAERTLYLKIVVESQNAVNDLNHYKNAIKAAGDEKEKLLTRSQKLNAGLLNLNAGLQVAQASFMALGTAIKIISDVNALGQKVNIASETFTALAGGSEAAAAMLELLSQKTGGVVDNLALMQGASRLLQMGLADSKEEVAGLTEMAIKLGGALGMDTNKAVEDFSLLLSNLSYLRLDQFGISAGAVRARVAELKDEFPNLTREARFAQAVLEEGQGAMQDLGTAIDASSTAVKRFETDATNAFQGFAANVNESIEQTFLFIEALEAIGNARLAEVENERLSALDTPGMRFGPMGVLRNNMLQVAQAAEEMAIHQQNEMNLLLSQASDLMEQQLDYRLSHVEIVGRQIRDEKDLLMVQQAQMKESGLAIAAAERNFEIMRNVASEVGSILSTAGGVAMEEFLAERSAGQELTSFENDTMGFQAWQPGEFLNPERNAQVQEHLAGLTSDFERIKELGEEGLISEEDVENASALYEGARNFASEAQRAADNYARMADSIASLTGTGGGGALGEINALVAEQLSAAGIDTTKFEEQGALLSGEDTLINQALQGEGIDTLERIYNEYGQDAYNTAVQNMIEGIQEARAAGLGDAEIAANLPSFTGFFGGSQTPGMAGGMLGGPAQGAGREDAMLNPEAAAAFDPAAFVEQMTLAADPVADMAGSFETGATAATTMSGMMQDVMTFTADAVGDMRTFSDHLDALKKAPNIIPIELRLDEHKLFIQLSNALRLFQVPTGGSGGPR